MRLERFVPAVDFNALCWASLAAMPLFAWKAADVLFPFPLGRFDPYFAFSLFAAAERYLVLTIGFLGLSLSLSRLLQRKAIELLSFSLTVNAVAITAFILVLQTPLIMISLGGDPDKFIATYALIVTVLADTSLLAAVGIASRLYVAWRTPPDVRRSAALFGIAFALAIITTALSLDRQFKSGSLAIDIASLIEHIVYRLIYSIGDVALFGSIAIGIVRRTGRDDYLAVILLAGIGAALAWWLAVYGPDHIELAIKSGFLPGNEFNPYPIGAIVRTALFGTAAGLVYFAVVYREAARALVLSLPTLISKARRWQPTDVDD